MRLNTRSLFLALSTLVGACSAAGAEQGIAEPQEAGANPTDSSGALPAAALTGRWRFCGLTKDVAFSVVDTGGSLNLIEATGNDLIATKVQADGGFKSPFFKGRYDPISRIFSGDVGWHHYLPLPDGGIPPLDQWLDYDEDAIQLTFNRSGDRAQGTITVARANVMGGVSGGREDGDFACLPVSQ